MSRQLDEALFEMKFSAKQIRKESEKLAKDEAKEKALMAKAIAKGQIEIARTHGVNAIQAKNLSLQMLQQSSKIDGCSKRLEHAMRLNQVSATMAKVASSIGVGLKSMQPDKIAMSMNDFEKAFESIEVSLGTMTGALETTTGSLVPTDEVDALMQAVAQENSIDMKGMMAAPGSKHAAGAVAAPSSSISDLEARLAALKDD